MSTAEREAALRAVHDARLALEQIEAIESTPEPVVTPAPVGSSPADEPVGAPVAVAEAPAPAVVPVVTKFLHQGSTYLGPCAVNGG